jgi:hypothetical protein
MIAVLLVGVITGCTTQSQDMTQAEVINIMDLAVAMETVNGYKHVRHSVHR